MLQAYSLRINIPPTYVCEEIKRNKANGQKDYNLNHHLLNKHRLLCWINEIRNVLLLFTAYSYMPQFICKETLKHFKHLGVLVTPH